MRPKEIRELGDDELIAKEKQLRRELFDYFFNGPRSKPHLMKAIKKDIARVLTIATQRGVHIPSEYRKKKG
ncbi:MAG: 50S ribosomal protein L29 [Deltaproteobacteria bacterium]|jgi:ribosomal protein L29|nr:50S ribosomal protein L29 [Deltaproteobacteria bacterium]